jgi:hypothetical protein
MASPIPLTQEEERLTQLYTNYFVQVEQISVKVRHLSNNKDLYNAAVAKWKNESPRIPPADDEKKRAEYLINAMKYAARNRKIQKSVFLHLAFIYTGNNLTGPIITVASESFLPFTLPSKSLPTKTC